jgi:hypothetical protein
VPRPFRSYAVRELPRTATLGSSLVHQESALLPHDPLYVVFLQNLAEIRSAVSLAVLR